MSPYRFGSFILDVRERRLLRRGSPVPLTPKVFDTLAYLVERHGHLVGKEELLEAIWGGASVEEGSLPRAIHVLRKALNGGGGKELHPQYIETVPTKGYRFVAEVTCVDADASSADLAVGGAGVERTAGRDAGLTRWRRALVAVSCLIVLLLVVLTWRRLDQHAIASSPGLRRLTPPTGSGAAYARFQSGRLRLERHLPGDVQNATADFDTAIQMDPAFADAYAGKADAKFFSFWDTGEHDDIAQARVAIRKSIELDRDRSYAHALLCRMLGTYDWDFAAAESECRRAVNLDSHNHEARRELAFLLSVTGRRADALKEMDAAIAIAPTSFNKRSRGLLLYFDRRFDEAIQQLKQVEATDVEYQESSRWLARSFEQKRDYNQALEFLIRDRESKGGRREQIALLRRTFATGGWPGVLRLSTSRDRADASLEVAGTYAQLNQPDEAFTALEAMISARQVMIVHMDSEPRLDPLRSDPRFDRLARRVGLR